MNFAGPEKLLMALVAFLFLVAYINKGKFSVGSSPAGASVAIGYGGSDEDWGYGAGSPAGPAAAIGYGAAGARV